MTTGYRIWELLDFICDVMIMTNQEQVLFLQKYLVLEIIIVLTKSLMPAKGLMEKNFFLAFTQYCLSEINTSKTYIPKNKVSKSSDWWSETPLLWQKCYTFA